MPPTITVIGSLNSDLITRTSRIPAPGETLTAQSFDTGSGGKGANQAVACARLSRPSSSSNGPSSNSTVSVRMIGAVGDDIFGHGLISGMRADGIDMSGVAIKSDHKTGVAVITVEESTGENRIMLAPNANYTLRPEDFTSIPSPPKPDLIVLQLEIPLATVLAILSAAQKEGIPVLLNPAPAVDLPADAYPKLTHLVLNETEAALLSGQKDLGGEEEEADLSKIPAIAESFVRRGVRNVIVTLGSKGVYFATREGLDGYIPAEKAQVVDTTAAGDTFVGAYAVEVVTQQHVGAPDGDEDKEFNIREAVTWANRAAAKTVERHGAQAAIPWADEVPR
ncbi:Ribokinase-like protein [Xylona heveae TC161]|uniref:Ribokinase n=1 Tax=Xylona heveae (strain CBS 132557 / TC161) TaxID=1328760 RepID=A0A165ABF1_XYLHT|nr:Ribokinase-like protein [Xylona heveae TC161]KZF20209.1 Ribokinase-like protein [Xylona heveae TC161]